VPHKIKDVVNGANWNYGYTGTQLNHGKPVRKWAHKRVGDLIHYRGHVAIYIGGGLVVSHGSEAGPLICRWNYRPVIAIRRYI
jgi:cell wall-associated NlpC family hydrolase